MKLAYEEWLLETVLGMLRSALIDDGAFDKCGTIHMCVSREHVNVFAYDKEGEKKVIDVNKLYD